MLPLIPYPIRPSIVPLTTGVDIDVVEDGKTFEENAMIKACEIAKYLPNDIVLADDSGLEIDYLNKEPGIYSLHIHSSFILYTLSKSICLVWAVLVLKTDKNMS